MHEASLMHDRVRHVGTLARAAEHFAGHFAEVRAGTLASGARPGIVVSAGIGQINAHDIVLERVAVKA